MEATISKDKTSLNLDENIESALCYILGFVTGFVFLVLEKDNKFVRFHAIQSIAVFLPLFVVGYAIGTLAVMSSWVLGPVFAMLSMLISLAEFILWIILMYKAYSGERYKLPIVGDIAEKNSQ